MSARKVRGAVLAIAGAMLIGTPPEVKAGPVGQLAQFSQSNSSSYSNSRANRRLIKLGVLAVVGIGVLGYRVLRSDD